MLIKCFPGADSARGAFYLIRKIKAGLAQNRASSWW